MLLERAALAVMAISGAVGNESQHDQITQSFFQTEARGEHVRGVGKVDAGDPHEGRREEEDKQ